MDADSDWLQYFVLADSAGNQVGVPHEMLFSEAMSLNFDLAAAHSDYRWSCIPEMGAR
jgi:hypothetical protein